MISNYLNEYFKSHKRKLSAEELLKIAIEFDINLEKLKKGS